LATPGTAPPINALVPGNGHLIVAHCIASVPFRAASGAALSAAFRARSAARTHNSRWQPPDPPPWPPGRHLRLGTSRRQQPPQQPTTSTRKRRGLPFGCWTRAARATGPQLRSFNIRHTCRPSAAAPWPSVRRFGCGWPSSCSLPVSESIHPPDSIR
jgi:hypothetical protein